MPIDAVAALEKTASFPHVTTALAEVIGATLSRNSRESSSEEYGAGGLNSDVIALSQRFAILISEYDQSIEDGSSQSTKQSGYCVKLLLCSKFWLI